MKVRRRFNLLINGSFYSTTFYAGIKVTVNEAVYTEAEKKIEHSLDTFLRAFIVPIVSSFTPFILVAYHWCMGKYTLDSWFYLFTVW